MDIETAVVMIVGVIALLSIRVILTWVGKEFAADHRRSESAPVKDARRVVRGTGRNRHLLYFADALPATAPAATSPAHESPVTALAPGRRAS